MFTRITGETFPSMSNTAGSAAPREKPPLNTNAIHWLALAGDHEKEALWARISPIDAGRCAAFAWRADRRTHTTYGKASVKAIGRIGALIWTTVSLHRFIAQPCEGFETHHRDSDGLNCVRGNLVNVTHSRNLFEREPYSQSGFYGVCKHHKKFRVYVSVRRSGGFSSKYIGLFDTALEGAIAYDQRMRELHGPFVRCNFPLDE